MRPRTTEAELAGTSSPCGVVKPGLNFITDRRWEGAPPRSTEQPPSKGGSAATDRPARVCVEKQNGRSSYRNEAQTDKPHAPRASDSEPAPRG